MTTEFRSLHTRVKSMEEEIAKVYEKYTHDIFGPLSRVLRSITINSPPSDYEALKRLTTFERRYLKQLIANAEKYVPLLDSTESSIRNFSPDFMPADDHSLEISVRQMKSILSMFLKRSQQRLVELDEQLLIATSKSFSALKELRERNTTDVARLSEVLDARSQLDATASAMLSRISKKYSALTVTGVTAAGVYSTLQGEPRLLWAAIFAALVACTIKFATLAAEFYGPIESLDKYRRF